MPKPSQKLMPQQHAPSPRDLALQIADAARFTRRHAIAAIYHAGSGHPGGAMSSADILASLFGAELNFWPDAINDPDRDRFVLSKGHGAPALYAVAAHFGFCDAKSALKLRKLGSPFQGHPHVCDLPWVETSTGSLGQGFSVALGMAMGLRLLNSPARVYTLLGDGELQEGEVWEAAMCAAHHKLDNLCAVIDYNKLQSDDRNDAIMRLEPLAAKWRAFDWAVAEVNGHDIDEILSAFRRASASHGRPAVIIAHTVKGKGVPYMENIPHWHGSVKLTRAQAEDALTALGASRPEIKELLDDSDR
jgi:transketolase